MRRTVQINEITASIQKPMHKILFSLTVLFCVSLVSSMAGIEFFSTLITLFVIVAVGWAAVAAAAVHYKWPEKSDMVLVRLGPDMAIWFFWGMITLGAFFSTILPKGMTFEVITEARWIIMLYTLAAAMTYLKDRQPRFLQIFAVLAIIVSVYSIVQTFTGFDLVRDYSGSFSTYSGIKIWRARGFFNNTMTYSYTMGALLCFLYGAIAANYFSGVWRKVIIASAFFLSISLLCTFTRGAWVGAVLAICTIFMLRNWRKGIVIIISIFIFAGVLSAVSPPVRERLYSIYKEDKAATSVSNRWVLWRANWAMFKDYPLLGVGYGQNSLFTQEYNNRLMGHDGFVENAHNNILQVLAGAGIFAFLAWLYFCGYFFWQAVRLWLANRKENTWLEAVALGSIGAQIFFHIGGLTQATFFDNEPLAMFLFFWAILASHAGQPPQRLKALINS